MAIGLVYRCATCSAPLEGTAGQVHVQCAYCGSENRLVSVEVENAQHRMVRFTQAAGEARQMAGELEARGAELLAAFQQESERAKLLDDAAAAHTALRHLEGYLRLQYAPTLHIYRSWDPADPQVVGALAEIDAVIDRALGVAAETLGVPYRSTRERLASAG